MSYASSSIKRLSNEYRSLQKPENRVREYYVAPLEDNIFEWHFTLRGPGGDDNSLPYKDGIYHGALIFSRSYPLEPPDIIFFTRSGRFAVREKICSTISSYHKELWQPTYDIALTLTALRHFMAQEDEFGVGAFPKNMIALETKEAWAKETWSFTCTTCGMATKDVWETEMKMYPEISPEKEAQVPKLPPPPPPPLAAAAPASATANPEDPKPKQDAPDTPPSSPASPPSTSPSSTLLPSPAAADASETAAKPAGAPQNHHASKDTQSSPALPPSAPTSPPSPPLGPTTTPRPPAADTVTPTTVHASALQSPTPGVHDAPHTPSSAAHEHTAKTGASIEEEGAVSEGADPLACFTDVSPARVVRTPVMTAPPPPAPAAADATPLVTSAVTDSVVAGDVAGASASPLSPTAAAVAPPQFAQRVVVGVNIMEVSIPLRVLDRAIILSFLLAALILLRRGLCGLLMS
ncbi:putative ubiquitin-conjugating enzyme [Leishmania mexicana MHOM/GT/2001/U1103]|uniref:Ubiquitin-conjugating enzyme n=1 Tax=Leishmania mexicana (strain MHOM/GT/2001/U1103) TaxID=929439 RepID=E9AKJ9_LEIMU|nr:putative ubiquitin-conjugating enzyme [Leishmania mexicana MHOM/GT/2001/U1103]CBZ23450.1 putative ubiquitin-conjugating enzyme [Leishmania mexicana MHOM/GT/2001/U1103]